MLLELVKVVCGPLPLLELFFLVFLFRDDVVMQLVYLSLDLADVLLQFQCSLE